MRRAASTWFRDPSACVARPRRAPPPSSSSLELPGGLSAPDCRSPVTPTQTAECWCRGAGGWPQTRGWSQLMSLQSSTCTSSRNSRALPPGTRAPDRGWSSHSSAGVLPSTPPCHSRVSWLSLVRVCSLVARRDPPNMTSPRHAASDASTQLCPARHIPRPSQPSNDESRPKGAAYQRLSATAAPAAAGGAPARATSSTAPRAATARAAPAWPVAGTAVSVWRGGRRLLSSFTLAPNACCWGQNGASRAPFGRVTRILGRLHRRPQQCRCRRVFFAAFCQFDEKTRSRAYIGLCGLRSPRASGTNPCCASHACFLGSGIKKNCLSPSPEAYM